MTNYYFIMLSVHSIIFLFTFCKSFINGWLYQSSYSYFLSNIAHILIVPAGTDCVYIKKKNLKKNSAINNHKVDNKNNNYSL